jgi:hypothetical protein
MRNGMSSKKLFALAFIALQSAALWAGPTQPTAVLGCSAGRVASSATQNLDSLDYELVNSAADDPGTRAVQLAEQGPHKGGASFQGEDYDAIRSANPTSNGPPTTSLQIRPDKRGVIYTAPPRRISSAMMKAAPKTAPETAYVATGKSAARLAEEHVEHLGGTTLPEEIGSGGMQKVFTDPSDLKGHVLKVYDGELMYSIEQKPFLKKIAEAKELIATGDPVKVAQGKDMITTAEIELDHLKRGMPAGKTYPSRFDDITARMIQRTKALGQELRNDVLPKIKIARTDGAGDIKISMCDGLENISDTGVSRVERVRVGPVDAANPTSDQWVEASDYFMKLTPESRRYQKVMDVDKAWREALTPYSDRIKEANKSMGLSLDKGNQLLGYDIGVGSSKNPLTNVFIRVDSEGTIVEIKVSDF